MFYYQHYYINVYLIKYFFIINLQKYFKEMQLKIFILFFCNSAKIFNFALLKFRLSQSLPRLLNVIIYSGNEFFQRREVHFRPDVIQDDNPQVLPIEVLVENVQDVGFHRLMFVFVVRIPADAHDHVVNGAAVNGGVAAVYARVDLLRQRVDDVQGIIGRGYAQLLGAASETLNYLTLGVMREALAPHDYFSDAPRIATSVLSSLRSTP